MKIYQKGEVFRGKMAFENIYIEIDSNGFPTGNSLELQIGDILPYNAVNKEMYFNPQIEMEFGKYEYIILKNHLKREHEELKDENARRYFRNYNHEEVERTILKEFETAFRAKKKNLLFFVKDKIGWRQLSNLHEKVNGEHASSFYDNSDFESKSFEISFRDVLIDKKDASEVVFVNIPGDDKSLHFNYKISEIHDYDKMMSVNLFGRQVVLDGEWTDSCGDSLELEKIKRIYKNISYIDIWNDDTKFQIHKSLFFYDKKRIF